MGARYEGMRNGMVQQINSRKRMLEDAGSSTNTLPISKISTRNEGTKQLASHYSFWRAKRSSRLRKATLRLTKRTSIESLPLIWSYHVGQLATEQSKKRGHENLQSR